MGARNLNGLRSPLELSALGAGLAALSSSSGPGDNPMDVLIRTGQSASPQASHRELTTNYHLQCDYPGRRGMENHNVACGVVRARIPAPEGTGRRCERARVCVCGVAYCAYADRTHIRAFAAAFGDSTTWLEDGEEHVSVLEKSELQHRAACCSTTRSAPCQCQVRH